MVEIQNPNKPNPCTTMKLELILSDITMHVQNVKRLPFLL